MTYASTIHACVRITYIPGFHLGRGQGRGGAFASPCLSLALPPLEDAICIHRSALRGQKIRQVHSLDAEI